MRLISWKKLQSAIAGSTTQPTIPQREPGNPSDLESLLEGKLKEPAAKDRKAKRDDSSSSKPIKIGMVTIFLTFGLFGTWASFAPINSAAVAHGVVAVAGSRKTIQHLEGGIVKSLFVKEGDKVTAGQVLIELDNTQNKAQLDISLSQYLITIATESRLLAERDQSNSVTFSTKLAMDDPRAAEAIEAQKQVFAARKAALIGEEELLSQRINQLESRATGIQAIVKGKKDLIESYDEERHDYNQLFKQGFADKVRLRELQRNRSTLLSEISELEAEAISTNLEIGESKLKQLQIHRDFRSKVVDELGVVKSQIFDLEEKIRALQDKVTRTQIIAPVNGIVFDLSVHTIGSVIQSGEDIMQLVPEADDLIIDAKLSPKDIDRVYVGQPTDIRFAAFNQRTTPVIAGKILRVSADALDDKSNGQTYYAARVEMTEEGAKKLGDLQLQPGMPAEIFINTGARTLLEYLLHPLTEGLARTMTEE